jgi:hypothetical protein
MRNNQRDVSKFFERGVAILSFDAEQIWGYLDLLNEWGFRKQFPDTLAAYDKLLEAVCSARISATWFVVGGMSLSGSAGGNDPRMAGLPRHWTAFVPAGNEMTRPLWYRRPFVERIRDASPRQEIGLHGGLTHLVWTDPLATTESLECELTEGIRALEQLSVAPRSFSYPRSQDAHIDLLPAHGIRCYRGRTPVLSYQLGRTLPGAILRMLDELRAATPPPVWPEEVLPGLWNIPSSSFLYPIGTWRSRAVPLWTRVERFRRGLEAAARYRGIFHFCLHPANLSESPGGFSMFHHMLERLARARDRGDIEILTVDEVASRVQNLRERAGLADVSTKDVPAGNTNERATTIREIRG